MRGGFLAATLVVTLTLATPAAGGEPTETLRRLFEHANRILVARDATDGARLTGLRALVREAFDPREAAALAFGRAWTSRTTAERDEFSRLYGDVIETAYLAGLGGRARVHADGIRVAFASESVQGTSATVVTTLQTRSGDPIPVEYRLNRGDGRWAVVDVVVEGLSLAGSYEPRSSASCRAAPTRSSSGACVRRPPRQRWPPSRPTSRRRRCDGRHRRATP